MKTFSEKQNLEEFIASRSALLERLKKVLPDKNKFHKWLFGSKEGMKITENGKW